jgi:thioredoxin reductase (NADPH)
MGLDVTVMVRSIFLRGFDQDMANKVAEYLQKQGIKFVKAAVPISIKLNIKKKKLVTFKKGDVIMSDTFDTVLFAIGRSADTKGLGLEKVGVKISKTGKIICKNDDTTDGKDIYAIGDVAEGRL